MGLTDQLVAEKEEKIAAMRQIDTERAATKSSQNGLQKEKSDHNTTKVNLDKLKIEFAAEKQKLGNVESELAQERSKVIATMNDLSVEKEQHNATKRELETAKLPFWKKFGM